MAQRKEAVHWDFLFSLFLLPSSVVGGKDETKRPYCEKGAYGLLFSVLGGRKAHKVFAWSLESDWCCSFPSLGERLADQPVRSSWLWFFLFFSFLLRGLLNRLAAGKPSFLSFLFSFFSSPPSGGHGRRRYRGPGGNRACARRTGAVSVFFFFSSPLDPGVVSAGRDVCVFGVCGSFSFFFFWVWTDR